MMRAAGLFLLTALGVGCTVTVEQVGPRALLEDVKPARGAFAESIVAGLGIPDEIAATEDGFGFVYHFARRNEKRFQIGSYGFKLATDERVEQREGSFEFWFDASGRLLDSRVHDHALEAEPGGG